MTPNAVIFSVKYSPLKTARRLSSARWNPLSWNLVSDTEIKPSIYIFQFYKSPILFLKFDRRIANERRKVGKRSHCTVPIALLSFAILRSNFGNSYKLQRAPIIVVWSIFNLSPFTITLCLQILVKGSLH